MTERILGAADRLFYQKGIRAVGVDAIAHEAGISKRSLYDTFGSKDALIAAYLARKSRPVPASDAAPAQQILAQFDALHGRFLNPSFRGCPFVNAVAELADEAGDAHTIARDFKVGRRDWFADMLARAGANQPDLLGRQIALLIDGAYATMLVQNDAGIALDAREAAITLMRAAGVAIGD
jgi:AcrR family transcriptional regulator